MCHAVAGLHPRITGSAAKIEVSLERPAMITSAPCSSASMYGSMPARPTIWLARSITPSSRRGALASGVILPSFSLRFR